MQNCLSLICKFAKWEKANVSRLLDIPEQDLQWYAAFHNEGHHPHIHMVAYLSDIDYDENIHDGLVDARNTTLLFRKMQTEEVFQFNKYYKMMIDEDQEYEQIGA